MGLLNWVFDIYQQVRIEKTASGIEQARLEAMNLRASAAASPDLARIEQAIGELALAVKTMQRIMAEKGVAGAEEFARKLEEIDREDGKADRRAPY